MTTEVVPYGADPDALADDFWRQMEAGGVVSRDGIRKWFAAAIKAGHDKGVEEERNRVKDETLDAIGHYVDIDERTNLAEAEFVKAIK